MMVQALVVHILLSNSRLRVILENGCVNASDSNRLWLGCGKIVEMDTPLHLWEQDGIFRSMCDRSGVQMGDFLADETMTGQGLI